MKKPVSPALHSIIDYAFSGLQILLPRLLRLPANSRTLYTALGLTFLGVNAVTDTPAAVKPVITFKQHQKTDAVFLTAFSLLPFAGVVRENKKTLLFHIGFFALAVSHYLLTDYEAGTK